MTRHCRIAMFSGPRNISTTMMRAFENRPDTDVIDEPFYACYLKESGANHPMREEILAAQSSDRNIVAAQLAARPTIDTPISFEKHIGFHFRTQSDLTWTRQTRVLQLIRDPRAMIASYKNKYDDIAPIVESYKVQRMVYDDCHARGVPCPVVDASDILRNPKPVLSALCNALEIDFSPAMLKWPAGPRDSDGVWGPHWYDAVVLSTGFRAFTEKPVELPPELEIFADQCANHYAFFHSRRVIADN